MSSWSCRSKIVCICVCSCNAASLHVILFSSVLACVLLAARCHVVLRAPAAALLLSWLRRNRPALLLSNSLVSVSILRSISFKNRKMCTSRGHHCFCSGMRLFGDVDPRQQSTNGPGYIHPGSSVLVGSEPSGSARRVYMIVLQWGGNVVCSFLVPRMCFFLGDHETLMCWRKLFGQFL